MTDLVPLFNSTQQWNWRLVSGSLPDGQELRGAGIWTFADDGNSDVLSGDVTIDGKPTPEELRDNYNRISN